MDYSQITKKTHELIKRFGLSVKITRSGASLGSAYGVFDDSKKEPFGGMMQAQTIAGERTLLLSGFSKLPEVGDVVTGDKDAWTVMSVEFIRPATTTVLYILKVQ